MSSVDFDKIWFKKLEETDDLSAFKCDEDDDGGCDEFIHKPAEAKQYQKERHGVTYLFYFGETMVGYITLAMSSISAQRLEEPENVRLRFYPCLLIGRLAVDNGWRRKGIGAYLTEWATGLAMELSEEVGCRYVVLEARESKMNFYEKCGFKKGASISGDKLVWLYKKIAN